MGEGAVNPSLFPSSQHPVQARAPLCIPGPAPTQPVAFLENTPTSGVSGKPGHIPSTESKRVSQSHQAFTNQAQTFGPVPGAPAPNSPSVAHPPHSPDGSCHSGSVLPLTKTSLCSWSRWPGAGFPNLSPCRRASGLWGGLGCLLCLAQDQLWGLQNTALGTPSTEEGKGGHPGYPLGLYLPEPSPASQEHYRSCWQTTGPGWGEAGQTVPRAGYLEGPPFLAWSLAAALPSPRIADQDLVPIGEGVPSPHKETYLFMPVLHHPAQVPWATPEKHTHFIFYFSYKRPSYHCLSYKNQSPCL